MRRIFGLETEYGITLSGAETVDVVAESIELVRRYTDHGALMKWDYDLEDPHLDARGFRARELLQDTDESAYYEIDKRRPLSFEEIKSDLVLSNGARFYNDHAHPEYSTPECTTLQQIAAQDKAGERILARGQVEQFREIVQREHLLAVQDARGQRPAGVTRQHGVGRRYRRLNDRRPGEDRRKRDRCCRSR